jgi:AcrR family transcriptional regulator
MARRPTKRARDDSAKAARREALLDELEALFREAPYERITLDALARRCGLAKGTLYLYFPTREAMFLALYLRHALRFAAALTAVVKAFPPGGDEDRLAAEIAGGLAAQPAFLKLMALVPTVLERNIDPRTAADFKSNLLAGIGVPARALEERLAILGKGDGIRLLLRLNALAVGLAEMAAPSPVVAAVVEADPRLQVLRIDFRAELAAALAALLRGWRSGT